MGNLYKLPPGPSCLIHCLHSLQLKGENRGKKVYVLIYSYSLGAMTQRLALPHDDDNWNVMMVHDDSDYGMMMMTMMLTVRTLGRDPEA